MTQRDACRRAAGPERDARADAPKVEQTVGSDRLPAAPLSSETFPRTGGFATPPYGRFAFVSVRPEGRGPVIQLDRHHQGVLRCTPFPESAQTCAAQAKYRHAHDRNKCEFVAHRRHNSSRACVTGDELKPFQGRADEISPAPLRLMSHARRDENHAKKRGRISCPSRNDHRGPLRLLLGDSYYFRTLCCTPIRTAVMSLHDCWQACPRTQSKSTVVFRKPGFRPVTPGDPWLCGPASRQVCLFVQPILRPWVLLHRNESNWRRFNLFRRRHRTNQ